jgi:probable rRNA maturation factor
VVISPVVARRQAEQRHAPLDDELALLVVHGVLHLLNYDHADAEETVVMERRQAELLARFREIEGGG